MISNRLKSLAKYLNNNDNVIDVGCDHALLDIYLIRNNILTNMIVSDVHENALNSGLLNIKRANLEDKIDARLGNGLEVLSENDNINTVLISGMGTATILKILNNEYLNKIDKLVIQSNRDYDILRKEVIKLGFYISNEEVIVDKEKLYINIVFLRGIQEYNDIELKYGISEMINKKIYYSYLINKYNNILVNLTNSEQIAELKKEIELLKGLDSK